MELTAKNCFRFKNALPHAKEFCVLKNKPISHNTRKSHSIKHSPYEPSGPSGQSFVLFMLATGSLTTGYSKFMYFAKDDGECSLSHQHGGPCEQCFESAIVHLSSVCLMHLESIEGKNFTSLSQFL